MQLFQERYQPHKTLLVGDGGLPWDEFLAMDVRDLF